MIIRKLNKEHYLCKGQYNRFYETKPSKRLSIGAKRFWNKYDFNSCSGAYGAFENGKLIGFVRFSKSAYDNTMYACGTYIEPNYRRKGIAKILWSKFVKLAKREEKCIEVCTASRGGRALIKSTKKNVAGRILIRTYDLG